MLYICKKKHLNRTVFKNWVDSYLFCYISVFVTSLKYICKQWVHIGVFTHLSKLLLNPALTGHSMTNLIFSHPDPLLLQWSS